MARNIDKIEAASSILQYRQYRNCNASFENEDRYAFHDINWRISVRKFSQHSMGTWRRLGC